MKICFISLKAYPLFNPKIKTTIGGAEVQLHMLATELARRKELDIHFIVADYNQQNLEDYKGVKVWKSLNFKSNKLLQIWTFFKVFNKANADVYVQRTLTVESGLIALYARLRRKKFVYMVAHDSEADGTHSLYKSRIKGLFARLAFKLANVVFVQNEYEREFLSKQIPTEKIVLLKKGLDLSKVISKRQAKYDGIWIGRSERWKRPEEFLSLAERNKDRKFLMICMKATNDPERFYCIKERASKIPNLTFFDLVTQKKIYEYLSESRVFVLTSEKEGDWPMTVLEASANGLPVLSLNLNYDYLIEKYHGGVFCEGRKELLDEWFVKICNDKVLYEAMSQKAYKYAEDIHDIKKNTVKFLESINAL